jgi:signal transduction histidine kinase
MQEQKETAKLTDEKPVVFHVKAAIRAMIALFVLTCFAVIFLFLFADRRYQEERAAMIVELGHKRAVLENRFTSMTVITSTLSSYLSINKGIDSLYFSDIASNLQKQIPIFKNITLAPNNITRYVNPTEGNEGVIGFNFMEHPEQRKAAERAIETKESVIEGPYELIQGGKGFIVRSPIFVFDNLDQSVPKYWGMISMVIDYDLMKKYIREIVESDKYYIALRDGNSDYSNDEVFYGSKEAFDDVNNILKLSVTRNNYWKIAATPKHPQNLLSFIPFRMYLLVTAIILALTSAVYFLFLNRYRLKMLHDEKDNLIQKLQESAKNQHKLYSLIAHDLRAPFSSLNGLLDFLDEDTYNLDKEARKKIVDSLRFNAKKFIGLTENLLSWARSQVDDMPFNPEIFPINSTIDECVTILKPVAAEKEISIRVNSEKTLEVFADENMISTVIRNLLSNAIKFSFMQSEITITVKGTGSEVQVSVADTGQGMSKDMASVIFEPVAGKTSVGTKGEQGSGLGLILCKEFVALHEGKIWYEENKPQGCVFSFSLPK